jgi:hypothetical protein
MPARNAFAKWGEWGSVVVVKRILDTDNLSRLMATDSFDACLRRLPRRDSHHRRFTL